MHLRQAVPFFLALLVSVALASAGQAKDTAEHLAANQTAHFTLEKTESKDYALSLNKGLYWLILDDKRVDGKKTNIQATVQLLKTNGVIVNNNLLTVNDIGVTSRNGTSFRLPKPTTVRLRVQNTETEDADAQEIWMTVVPAATMHFVPLGFGGEVQTAKVDAEEGVGGTLTKGGDAFYYRVMLPPGKWSISLGLTLAEKNNLQGSVDLLDAYGFTQKLRYVNVNEIGTQARQETIMTVTKPKTFLLRVVADSNAGFGPDQPEPYDLTIRKATD